MSSERIAATPISMASSTPGDLILVLQSGGYEDGVSGNATWATGDWNGDLEFDTSDFVAALQEGGFEIGPRARLAAAGSVRSVPEPSSALLLWLGLWGGLRLAHVRRAT